MEGIHAGNLSTADQTGTLAQNLRFEDPADSVENPICNYTLLQKHSKVKSKLMRRTILATMKQLEGKYIMHYVLYRCSPA